ncbi:MAG: hypothetical protein KAT15_09410, partial [Bacteroidales bacterium]|nr:hypothetical protein [Bacteroidales bacterium]
ALFYPFQFKVNLEDEITSLLGGCEIVVPRVVLKELNKLQEKGNKNAGAAMKYAERFETLKGPSGEIGDSSILAAAQSVGGILVTSDRELIGRAKEKGLRVIFLRGRQRLELK